MTGIMDLIERFVTAHERIAAANEKIAEGMAHPTSVGFIDYGQSDGTECTAGQPAGHMMAMQDGAPAQTKGEGEAASEQPGRVNHAAFWDPYTAPVAKQYHAEKQAILAAELKKYGLEPGAKMTGAQMHELLLQTAKERGLPGEQPAQGVLPGGQMPAAPVPPTTPPVAPVMAPAAPVAPAAPAGQVYTAEVYDDANPAQRVTVQIHAGLADDEIGMNQLRAALSVFCAPGGDRPQTAAGIIQQIGGASRLTDPASGKRLIPDTAIAPIFRALLAAM